MDFNQREFKNQNFVLDSVITNDPLRSKFEAIAEKYLLMALEEYDYRKDTEKDMVIIAMINSLTDRLLRVFNMGLEVGRV